MGKKSNIKNLQTHKYAFTIVELIVVIVIIAILATIGFVSYSNYIGTARDSNRISQVARVTEGLQIYALTSQLPLPDDYINIENAGTPFAYQGSLGKNILQAINYSTSVLDPKDNTPFTYLVTDSRKSFQILIYLENPSRFESFHPQIYAGGLQNRHIQTSGFRLGGLVEADTLIPIEKTSLSVFDITDTSTDRYRSYLGYNEYAEGIPIEIQELEEVMRDKGRGWKIKNNRFECMNDPDQIFTCSASVKSGGGPTPGPPGAIPPIVTWISTPDAPSIYLSSSTSSSEYNNFEVLQEISNADITIEVGDTNNTISTRWQDDTIIGGHGNNRITVLGGNNTINLGDGYNHITTGNANDTLTVGHGDNIIDGGSSGSKTITLGNGNNTIDLTGYGNHIIQLGNGDNTITLNGGSTEIITGVSGSLDITFGGDQSRTTVWRGGNLIVRDFWRWGGNVINVAEISDLNNCSQVESATSWNGTIATITSSQGTLTLHMQDGQTMYNCNDRFQF